VLESLYFKDYGTCQAFLGLQGRALHRSRFRILWLGRLEDGWQE